MALSLLACRRPTGERVRVAAAISLQGPLEELRRSFAARGLELEPVLGGSGLLAQQIAAGAPVDLFASAAEGPLDDLVQAGFARRECTLAHNQLVLIAARGFSAPLRWETLASEPAVRRIALGLPHAVPAGDYADQTLRALGLLQLLSAKIVRAGNVRQVLELVARGEAEAGIVYATDVRDRDDVVVLGPPPIEAAPQITYPLGRIRQPRETPAHAAAVDAVASALCGAEGRARFTGAGFGPP